MPIAASGQGRLDWFIFQNRNELYTDRVFAGLAMVEPHRLSRRPVGLSQTGMA
jgi:hypothetical protein